VATNRGDDVGIAGDEVRTACHEAVISVADRHGDERGFTALQASRDGRRRIVLEAQVEETHGDAASGESVGDVIQGNGRDGRAEAVRVDEEHMSHTVILADSEKDRRHGPCPAKAPWGVSAHATKPGGAVTIRS